MDILVAGKRTATIQYWNPAMCPVTSACDTNNVSIIYYVNDTLGSSTLALNEKGAIIERTETKPYGDIRYENNNKTTVTNFALHDRNDQTGLIDMEARYYSPNNKSFSSQDPISKYSPQQYLLSPQELNMYSYGKGNPVMYNDPTGLLSKKAVVTAVKKLGSSAGSSAVTTGVIAKVIKNATKVL